MSTFISFILVSVLVLQVYSTPIGHIENNLEEELQEIHNVKNFEPSSEIHHRTIRNPGKPTKIKNSDKPTDPVAVEPSASEVTPDAQPEERSLDQQQFAELNQEELRAATQDNVNERSAQDLLSQESNQQARTHLSHPLIDKLKGLKGYGTEYSYAAPSYQPIYQEVQPIVHQPILQPIVHEEPILQPVVHQKPVLFHQEVIKPIIHEVVKPMPVFHETVRPIVHEVVKTLPVVKEVIKPVPVVHEILKPYSVPVVHPVQFHHQPTKINVPMEWSCQLVPGPGGPAVSGIQNGYGSYGSYSAAPYPSASYSSYSPAISQGSLYGLGAGHGASLGTYSLPIKTLPPKVLGHGHGLFKSESEGRDDLQDAIEDMVQREELNYSSMGPSETSEMDQSYTMRSLAQENPQLFARVTDSMNKKRTNLRNNMRTNIVNFQETPIQGMPLQPQSLTNEKMIRMAMGLGSQPSSGSMRNMQMIPVEQFPLNSRTVQIPMIKMDQSWAQQRSAELDQQISMEQMRAAQEQQMSFEQMRSTQFDQGLSAEQLKAAQDQQLAAEQMRSAELTMQAIPVIDMNALEQSRLAQLRSAQEQQMMEQMRSAQSQQMRSAQEQQMMEQIRSAQEQQMMEQIRSAQEQQMMEQMRSAQSQQMRSAQEQQMMEQIRSAQSQQMRSAQEQQMMEQMRSAQSQQMRSAQEQQMMEQMRSAQSQQMRSAQEQQMMEQMRMAQEQEMAMRSAQISSELFDQENELK